MIIGLKTTLNLNAISCNWEGDCQKKQTQLGKMLKKLNVFLNRFRLIEIIIWKLNNHFVKIQFLTLLTLEVVIN